jgi:hypothetical protein
MRRMNSMLTKIHGVLVKKGIIVFAILCSFAVLAGASGCRRAAVSQPQDFEYLEGKLVHRQGKALCLESADGRKTYFLVGRRTVFTPKAWPSLGDRLRVKYHVQAYPHKSFGRYYVGYEVAQIPDIEKVPRVTASSPPTQKPKPTTPYSEKPKKPPGPVKPKPSSIRIHKIETKPATILAGSKFDVEVKYTVTDPAVKAHKIPVQFSFSILSGNKVLFEKKPVELESNNGSSMERSEHLKASNEKGNYKIKVLLKYKEKIAEGEVDLEIK